jgi:hypothetical protein
MTGTEMTPENILNNADRLISDARFMHASGRSRSAATLITVALEQMGSYIEELTHQKHPDAVLYMGIFGKRANAHCRRQDALAGHVLNMALGDLTTEFMWEQFIERTRGCGDSQKLIQWMLHSVPIEFKEPQKQRMKDSPELKAASLLMHLVRQDHLKKLREYGLYSDSKFRFTAEMIETALQLAETVRNMLQRSPQLVVPEPMQLAGVNMPEGLTLPDRR